MANEAEQNADQRWLGTEEGERETAPYLGMKSFGLLKDEVEQGRRQRRKPRRRVVVQGGICGEFGSLDEAENDGVLLSDQALPHRFKSHAAAAAVIVAVVAASHFIKNINSRNQKANRFARECMIGDFIDDQVFDKWTFVRVV